MIKKRLLIVILLLITITIVSFGACNNAKQEGFFFKLPAPTIQIHGNMVSWQEAEQAEGYVVNVGGKSFRTADTNYRIEVADEGEYTVSVKAYTIVLGKKIYSEASNQLTYVKYKQFDKDIENGTVKLTTPEIDLDNDIVFWDVIHFATMYRILVNEVEVDEVVEPFYRFTSPKAGKYAICIKAVSTMEEYAASDKSNTVNIEVSEGFTPVTVNILDEPFSAKGDGQTNDRQAIQSAIDYVSEYGGGIVEIPANRTYKTGNLFIKSNVTLNFGDGAVLKQSDNTADYIQIVDGKYQEWIPSTGVYMPDDSIAWNHTWLYNLPFIGLPTGTKNVHINGGTLKMVMINNSQEDTIHMVCFCAKNSSYVAVDGLSLINYNAYGVEFRHCDHVLAANITIKDYICECNDGIHLVQTKNARVTGCFIESGDDGLMIVTNYDDPRQKASMWNYDVQMQENTNIEIDHNYVNAAGNTKSFGFILWGSGCDDLSKIQVRDVYVHNNTFRTLGIWTGDPWHPDEVNPVTDFYWENNTFAEGTNLNYSGMTNSNYWPNSKQLLNTNFDDSNSFWSVVGKAGSKKENDNKIGYIDSTGKHGELFQGISVKGGEKYLFKVDVKTHGVDAVLFVRDFVSGEIIAQQHVSTDDWEQCELVANIENTATYQIGVMSGDKQKGEILIDNASFDVYVEPFTIIDDDQKPTSFVSDEKRELGVEFETLNYTKVKKIKFYVSSNDEGVHTARIWNKNTGSCVAGPYQIDVNKGQAGWIVYKLSQSVVLQPSVYVLSVSTSDINEYCVTEDYFTQENNNGVIRTFAQSGVYGSEIGAMPTQSSNNANYFINAEIELLEQSFFTGIEATNEVFEGPFKSTSSRWEHLGVVFKAACDGFVTKVKIYAPKGESGIHKVAIWDYDTRECIAGEYDWDMFASKEGWYEFTLPKAVYIRAGEKYVASCTVGDNQKAARGPYLSAGLTKGDITIVPNGGVYASKAGAMPIISWNGSNYLRDICFISVKDYQNADQSVLEYVRELVDISVKNFETIDNNNVDSAWAILDIIDSYCKLLKDNYSCELSQEYQEKIQQIKDAIKVYEEQPIHYESLFANEVAINDGTAGPFSKSTSPEVGLVFKSDRDGYITKIKMYAPANDSGVHYVSLWDKATKVSLTGILEWTFSTTKEGWYEFTLPTPILISANKEYVASCSCGDNKDLARGVSLGTPYKKGNLTALPNGGVYGEVQGKMPEEYWGNSNYLRDVEFIVKEEYEAVYGK